MDVVVEYGKDIKKIYDEVKEVISREVGNMTHLDVIEVNVNVADIKSKKEYEEDSETVQDKVTDAASTAGSYISKQSAKAKRGVDKGVNEIQERTEPRVE
jgi:Fe2+ transport system protein B